MCVWRWKCECGAGGESDGVEWDSVEVRKGGGGGDTSRWVQ